MLSNFLLSETLPGHGKGTRVWWSWEPSGQAFVFVHGFGGHAVDTWTDFPSLLSADPAAAGWDLFCFGYDGLHTQAGTSAGFLRQFLDALTSSPESMYKASKASLGARSAHPSIYSRIVVVAHSLGAVVSRRMLLDAYNLKRPWAARTELLFFAPAHRGSTTLEWWRSSPLGPAMQLVSVASLLGRYSVLHDLKKESDFLKDLHADLIAAYKPALTGNLAARHVAWAEDEQVVSNLNLPPDPPGDPLRGTDHATVCKPHWGYTEPLSRLLAHI